MTVTIAEMQYMSIKELSAARWRADAAVTVWLIFGMYGLVDFLVGVGLIGDRAATYSTADVVLGICLTIYSFVRAYANIKAEQRLRAALHQARAARPILDRYR